MHKIMILKRLKLFALTILGAPLVLLSPLVRRSVRKLEEQYENDSTSLPEEIRRSMHFTRLDDKAYAELKKGKYDLAEKLATELLEISSEFKDNWNYGNAIHHSYTILGLVEIRKGNIDNAAKFLKRSGDTPGSPQLDSHGPSFYLAMELLLNDRNEDVLNYLSQVERFWEYGYRDLPKWIEVIKKDDIPESWQRLQY